MDIRDKLILCDVDGVLADFVGSLLKASGSKLKPSDIDEWDMFSMMEPEARERAFKILEDKSFWRELPLLPHAQDQIELLKRQNNKILYVTSPWANETTGWKTDGWGYARFHWLREHFGGTYKDVILTYSKQYVSGDILIDDRYKNIMTWAEHNPEGQAILVERPYNKSLYWSKRIIIGDKGWDLQER